MEQTQPELGALREVQRITALSKSEIWRRTSRDPKFPKPIRLGSRCTRWNLPEVRAYVAALLAEREARR